MSLAKLRREARTRERTSARSRSSAKAARTRKANVGKGPSELSVLRGWRSKDESDWRPTDALGYYATAYLREVGSEDPELKSVEARKRCAAQLSKVMRELSDDESVREYIDFGIRSALRGKGYPSDRTPSVSVLLYRWIVLKRWRSKRRKKKVSRRGGGFVEGK